MLINQFLKNYQL